VARVVVTETAARQLAELVDSHSLPADTSGRVARSLVPLQRFPRLGPVLDPMTPELRFLVGPWRWLVIVYAYREADDLVAVITFEDGRSARALTARRERH